ncbi:breast carcinoma-amplified sequence 1 isoform X2 [Acomys russatus]|uniref:breast carcinoma-amplified sequence 1 isoform X2 n=1 Tax=Acomys russatus TaxID=60746 RepID=UPI0021E32601|nr:breast carcinoma-amplified sequence 1 isoform X2 [Acomys russatus]
MGNQMSIPLRTDDQENDPEADTYKAMSDNECVQNGNPVLVSTHVTQHYDEVDLGISISKDNVAASSPKTTEEAHAVADASGKNLGKGAKPEAPAARSHFFLTLSRPVPGRPGDQGTDSSAASGRLDVSPGTVPANKDPSEHGALPMAAAPGPAADKTPGCAEAKQQALPATCLPPPPSPPESQAEGQSRPKDFSFFNRFFKLDKGRESVPVDRQPKEAKGAEDQAQALEAPAVPGNSHGVSACEDIVDSEERGQEVDTLSCSVPGDPEVLGSTKEDPQVVDTTENRTIMSFLKTLVSPNKTETKKDPEDTATKVDSVCDGHAGQKMLESQAKSKKKRLDSPRLGLTFRKFFRHKDTENSPTTSANVKSDKANFTSQETQGATKSSKGCSPPGHMPPASGATKEGDKEKSGPTSLPLGKLFRKKSVKEDSLPTGAEENAVCESPVETVRFEEVESTLQTVDLNEEENGPEPTDVRVKEESKPRRTPLMAFLRQMSVKGRDGTTRSEETNGKDSSCQTSNPTEKTPSPPEPEPVGTAQKSKETSSKDKKSVEKKSVAETNKQKSSKQEAKEPVQCMQSPMVEANSLQNGDKTPKRSEKQRQSLGGFLKGLGPKRMLDAQVQTDPVSIGPVGKSK